MYSIHDFLLQFGRPGPAAAGPVLRNALKKDPSKRKRGLIFYHINEIGLQLKGDTAASFFGGVKNCTDLNFSHFL
jgi:hypothetical protein